MIGKYIARPVKSFNHDLVAEFDEKMKHHLKMNFVVSDPNSLLTDRLPDGSPGLVRRVFSIIEREGRNGRDEYSGLKYAAPVHTDDDFTEHY